MCIVPTDTPSSFLQALENIWHRPGCWYFRGQASEKWPLKASLSRLQLPTPKHEHAFENALSRLLSEHLTSRSDVPHRHILKDDFLVGLARHYGAPTRVLDWTSSVHIAAWFATDIPRNKELEGHSISVFALDQDRFATKADPGNASNPNLGAQRGILLAQYSDNPDWWEAAQAEAAACGANPGTPRPDICIRVDLPRDQAHALRAKLAELGVDAISLFPGLEGFVREATASAWQEVRNQPPSAPTAHGG